MALVGGALDEHVGALAGNPKKRALAVRPGAEPLLREGSYTFEPGIVLILSEIALVWILVEN